MSLVSLDRQLFVRSIRFSFVRLFSVGRSSKQSPYPDDPGMHNPHGRDMYTNVTYRQNPGFCERVRNSLVAIVVGIVLLVVSCCLLFWNEGRAVQTAQSLDEGLRVLTPLTTTDVAFEMNNGHLVYMTGSLHTEKPVFDPVYKVSVKAIKLRRTVEMYQWVEHQDKREVNEGDVTREETTYSYSLIDQISDFKELPHSSGMSYVDSSLQFFKGYYYSSNNPQYPQLGDIRVKFEYAGLLPGSDLGPPTEVSIVAKQQGSWLETYHTEAGDDLEMLYIGQLSPREVFAKAHATNTLLTWGIRFGGWLLMFVAFGCMTSIVTTLVDWLPVVRELVAMGMGALNAALSISLSLTVIALGWIRYRPWLGILILVMAATPFFFTRLRMFQSSTSRHRNV
ncbi:hypothetical protein BaRGS_00022184 [Batillaria attramentaria]|uniref:Transmembrane protein 43 n=1 Tax=Batillaria attramentaria TaxID=370345 RepID=A0ABD0KH04_9CAEN